MLSKKILLVFAVIALVLSCSLASAGDETWINEDLKNSESDVYTLRAGTHTISDQIIVPEGKTVQGEVSESGELLTTIFLEADSNFDNQVPLVALNDNCKVLYIDFNGNSENQKNVPVRKNKQTGNGYHNFIGCKYKDNIEVAYCNFYNNLGDGLRLHHGKNISFHDNTGTKGGHDICFIVQSENVKVYNNYLTQRVNSAIRFMDVNNGQIYNNTIVMTPGLWPAGPAIQIQNDEGPMNNIEVFGNTVYNSCGPDIWLVGKPGRDSESIHIFFNVFYNGGWNSAIPWPGGIIASGFDNALIENNVWDGAHMAAVSFWAYADEWALPATATLDSNIFINSVPGGSRDIGGWGINNEISKQSVVSSSNCYYNNEAGPVNGCEYSDSDMFINPKENSVPCAVKWDGERWVIPGYTPKDFEFPPSGAYDNIDPLTDEEIEKYEFDDIFDILNVDFSTSGRTEQTADDIRIEIEETVKGKITGGIKIVGFKDVVYIDGKAYIPDNDSVLVKYVASQTPINVWYSGGTSSFEKDVKTEIKDGVAYANLTITMKWYTIKENKVTGHKKKVHHTSTATFEDSCPAPSVMGRPTEAKGILYEYPIHSLAYVTPDGLTAVEYDYDGEKVKHIYLLGERQKTETGVIYTNFSKVNYWEGDLPHQGEFLFINGSFDPEKLTVTAYTPYESFQVTHLDYVKKDYPDKFYAGWLFPSFGLFLILGFGAWYYIRKILY